MPYINIKVAGEVTKEQKADIVKQVTETMETVLQKDPSKVLITIETYPHENWGRGGALLG